MNTWAKRLLQVATLLFILGAINTSTSAMPIMQPLNEQENHSVQDASNVDFLGQLGGMSYAVAVEGSYAYIGFGPRLLVLDISIPNSPIVVGETQPFPGIVNRITVSGNYAYVADGDSGLRVVDILNPTNPLEIGFCENIGNIYDVTVLGNYAYVADYDYGLRVMDISNPKNLFEVGSYQAYGYSTSVAVSGSYAYLTSRYIGLTVLDVSNPADPLKIGYYDTPVDPFDVAISGNYAYVGGVGYLWVVDISNPTNPIEVGYFDFADWGVGVAISGNYAYIIGGNLWIVDISNPTNPIGVGFYEINNASVIVVSAGFAYVADNYYGLRVLDISNPSNPYEVGFYGISGFANGIAISMNYAYMADGVGIKTVDVENPISPFEIGFYGSPTGGWAKAVAVSGNYAYVADDSSLRVIDISNPANPYETGFYITPDGVNGVSVLGNYAYLADYISGLRVVDISNPSNPFEVGHYITPHEAYSVAVMGNYAYVGDALGLRIIDISNPTNPLEVGSYNTPGFYVYGVTISGSYAYLADNEYGLRVIDVSSPSDPNEVGFYNTPGHAYGVFISGSYAYVADDSSLQVVDISNPASPVEAGFYDLPGDANNVAVSGNYVYVADGAGGLWILRFTGGGGTTYSISGQIEDSNHNPIPGVTVSAGPGYSANTDNQGNYRIDNLLPNTYTVLPSLTGYTFNPLSQVRTLPRDTAPADFTAIPIQITNIEINQGLGNQFQGEQNFVAEKETAIRVILNAPVIIDPQNQQLVVRRNDGFTAYLVPRGKLNTTTKILIFLCDLPSDCGNWDSGDYTFEATVNGITLPKSVTFQPRNTLRILAVPIKIKYQNEIISLPDNQWKTAWSFTNKVYPIASDSIIWTENEELDATDLDLTTNIGKLILQGRLLFLQPFGCGAYLNPPCFDKIIGFIPAIPICGVDQCTGSGCLRGWTRGTLAAVVMANGSYINPSDGKKKIINSMQQAVAHEIGHTFGLGDEYDKRNGAFECQINPAPSSYFGKFSDNYSNECNPNNCPGPDPKWRFPDIATGSTIYRLIDHPFDVDGIGLLGDKLSFMGSAGERPDNYWITPPAYHHLFGKFAPDNLALSGPNQVARVMHANGWIGKDDSITIDPGYSFTETLPIQIFGTYTIEAVDAISNTLASQGFDVSYVVLSDPPQDIDPAPFNVDIVYPIGTAAFRIKHGETVLRVVPVTAHAPVVSVLYPNGGETWGADENQTISWTGSDADGDPLTYIILYSPDGINWMTLGAMIKNTQLIVDTSQIAGGDTASIRVIATDGVNTSMDDSNGVFSVGKKAPEAFILSPADNAILPFGVSSFLHGYAYDLEDGTLADSALQWYSDKDGYLGNGKLILVDLSYGSHIITLTVMDSDGNATSASSHIFVGNQIYLPLTIKR